MTLCRDINILNFLFNCISPICLLYFISPFSSFSCLSPPSSCSYWAGIFYARSAILLKTHYLRTFSVCWKQFLSRKRLSKSSTRQKMITSWVLEGLLDSTQSHISKNSQLCSSFCLNIRPQTINMPKLFTFDINLCRHRLSGLQTKTHQFQKNAFSILISCCVCIIWYCAMTAGKTCSQNAQISCVYKSLRNFLQNRLPVPLNDQRSEIGYESGSGSSSSIMRYRIPSISIRIRYASSNHKF